MLKLLLRSRRGSRSEQAERFKVPWDLPWHELIKPKHLCAAVSRASVYLFWVCFFFRYNLEWGNAEHLPSKPQEIHPWNQDGLHRDQEEEGEGRPHSLPEGGHVGVNGAGGTGSWHTAVYTCVTLLYSRFCHTVFGPSILGSSRTLSVEALLGSCRLLVFFSRKKMVTARFYRCMHRK